MLNFRRLTPHCYDIIKFPVLFYMKILSDLEISAKNIWMCHINPVRIKITQQIWLLHSWQTCEYGHKHSETFSARDSYATTPFQQAHATLEKKLWINCAPGPAGINMFGWTHFSLIDEPTLEFRHLRPSNVYKNYQVFQTNKLRNFHRGSSMYSKYQHHNIFQIKHRKIFMTQ